MAELVAAAVMLVLGPIIILLLFNRDFWHTRNNIKFMEDMHEQSIYDEDDPGADQLRRV